MTPKEEIALLTKGLQHEQKVRVILEKQLEIATRFIFRMIGECDDKYFVNCAREAKAKIGDVK